MRAISYSLSVLSTNVQIEYTTGVNLPRSSTIDPEELDVFIRTVYGEARGEGPEGQAAVAHTILNRAMKNKKSIKQVCLAPRQFSAWNRNDPNRKKIEALSKSNSAYKKIQSIIIDVLDGKIKDPTDGCTHYYSTSLKTPPYWAKDKKVVITIGKHRFLKDIDSI